MSTNKIRAQVHIDEVTLQYLVNQFRTVWQFTSCFYFSICAWFLTITIIGSGYDSRLGSPLAITLFIQSLLHTVQPTSGDPENLKKKLEFESTYTPLTRNPNTDPESDVHNSNTAPKDVTAIFFIKLKSIRSTRICAHAIATLLFGITLVAVTTYQLLDPCATPAMIESADNFNLTTFSDQNFTIIDTNATTAMSYINSSTIINTTITNTTAEFYCVHLTPLINPFASFLRTLIGAIIFGLMTTFWYVMVMELGRPELRAGMWVEGA
ncbi:hypothetical protein AX16_009071 [Volvariella volvacea WC 439]|nr:hypothetical protein AX16_009071 [Volvariella volvacea WC 439]